MSKHPHLTGEALDEAIANAARCRASRTHLMYPVPSDGRYVPTFGSLVQFQCEVCGTIRYDIVNRHRGVLLYRWYDQPPWYQQANEERQDGDWWRAAYFNTLPDDLFVEGTGDDLAPRRAAKKAANG